MDRNEFYRHLRRRLPEVGFRYVSDDFGRDEAGRYHKITGMLMINRTGTALRRYCRVIRLPAFRICTRG